MRFRFLLFCVCLFAAPMEAAAQNFFWVELTDKPETRFDACAYFDPKAVERRVLQGLPAYDWTDLPVYEPYLQQIAGVADTVYYASRWLNAVAVAANDEQLRQIKSFSFVRKIAAGATGAAAQAAENPPQNSPALSEEQRFLLTAQTEAMNARALAESGLSGRGVRVAVFDAGFPGANVAPELAHLFAEKRVAKTFDFVKKKENVFLGHEHGTLVLSCIAGKTAEHPIGLAPEAEFLLARTEQFISERIAEEYNWLAAVEWADKNGADLINSSLGYTAIRYTYRDMDGQTAYVTRAANLAAAKGILVINAMGNEGGGKWKYMGAPADADSVISVGAIDPFNRLAPCSFSSVGPTFDGRAKPNVSAFGLVMARGEKKMKKVPGTSFASPLTAGFAACLRQKYPNEPVMKLFERLQMAGSLYPYFDYAVGYGTPQGNRIALENAGAPVPTFDLIEENQTLKVVLKQKPPAPTAIKTPTLYYHIQAPNGRLAKYAMIAAEQKDVFSLDFGSLPPQSVIRFHYEGYTAVYTLRP